MVFHIPTGWYETQIHPPMHVDIFEIHNVFELSMTSILRIVINVYVEGIGIYLCGFDIIRNLLTLSRLNWHS